MQKKLQKIYNNLLQQTKSTLPKQDKTQYILTSSIITTTKPETKPEIKPEIKPETKPEPVDSKCIIM